MFFTLLYRIKMVRTSLGEKNKMGNYFLLLKNAASVAFSVLRCLQPNLK